MEVNRENEPAGGDSGQQWDSLSSVPFGAVDAEKTETKSAMAEIIEDISSADVVVYERLNASNDAAAKEEFLANPDLVHPNNIYGFLNPEEIQKNLNTLEAASAKIEQANISEQQKHLLKSLHSDCFKKNDFLAANIEYNNATTPEAKRLAAKHHNESNEALYGKVDEDTFNTLLREKLASIDVDSLSSENRAKYDKLIEKLGPLKEETGERFRPKEETVQRFGELVREFFKDFLKYIPDDKEEFTGEDMAEIVNAILTNEFSDEPDSSATPYRAVVSPTAANASVNHENRTIVFSDHRTYTHDQAAALVIHELGTHALRAIPYTDQDITAFSTGFPNNETFDEGVAVSVARALSGKYSDSGVSHYISLGLATYKDMNFREVYDTMHAINDLNGAPSKTLLNIVQRCFRGTGELPNNKDMAYYNGSEMVWKYIEEHIDDPELFDNLFLTGKLVITDPEQERISYEKRTGKL